MPRSLITCFLLIALLFLALAVYGQSVQIAQCHDGVCIIAEETLERLVAALEHWYSAAKGQCV